MIKLHRGFLSATNTAAFTSSSSSSALQVRFFMAKLRALHNYPGTCLPCSSFGASDKCTKSSPIRLKHRKFSCTLRTEHTRVGKEFYPLRSCGNGSQSNLRLGFVKSFGSVNNFSYGSLNKGASLSLPSYGAFTKRFFSQKKLENMGAQHGEGGGSTSALWGFSKRQKQAKALAANGKTRAASSSSSKEISLEASNEPLVGGGRDTMDPGSSIPTSLVSTNEASNVNRKKKPRTKKSKKQEADDSSLLTADATKGARGTSQAKKSIGKSEQDPLQASELNLNGNRPVEIVDSSSSSTKPLSSKKSGKTSSKEKSGKGTENSLQKHKARQVGQIKRQRKMSLKPLYPPTGKSIVVVESVTKAKVIQGYVGDMYKVIPSYGHVRDLARKSGSVRPEEDFSMVWEVPSASWSHLKSIQVALSGAENLILASDPDREGEAIAWHIIEMLQQQDCLRKNITVARVVFHEITESSVKRALQTPRELDENLVHAYLARRALDYLIGFSISPLLWRKLPGCQSAGRVQSAALALICDREIEIDQFEPQEYWTIDTEFQIENPGSKINAVSFKARLTHYDSNTLNQLSIGSHTYAKEIGYQVSSENFKVVKSKTSKMRRNPPSPYITSTLQQDASNKLHFSSTFTMKLAQKLYEGIQLSDGEAAGLITYMRTDGCHISDEAVKDIRSLVTERYGQNFASASPQKYFNKVKNAQEAHEAIRPTDISRLPSMLRGILDEDSLKLYTLIWCRTVACQMEHATIKQIQVDIGNATESIVFRSACSVVKFLGYQAVFKDVEAEAIQHQENEGNDRDELFRIIDSLKTGDPLHIYDVELEQHHTQPPPRYSEGALVKKLEELGIGRPSTYASTIKVLQDRNYVNMKQRVLHPEFRGRMVSAFLNHHFSEVMDYSFTADMETELDNVSAGLTKWKGLLRDYWTRFSSYCEKTSNVHIHQVEKMLEKKFEDFLFASFPDKTRTCPSCFEGTLVFKVSRLGSGYFIGCDQHPKCKYIAKTLYGDEEEVETPQGQNVVEEPKLLGLNPGSNEKVLLKNGPYGYYLQLGEDRKNFVPKRASVSHIKDVESITLEDALELLQYPLTLGTHPDDGQPVILKLAKGGFTVRHRRNSATVPKTVDPKDVDLTKALKYLSGKDVRRSGRPKSKPKVEEAIQAM